MRSRVAALPARLRTPSIISVRNVQYRLSISTSLTYKRIVFIALNETCIVPSLDQRELDYALINRLLSTIYLKYYDSLTLDHKS